MVVYANHAIFPLHPTLPVSKFGERPYRGDGPSPGLAALAACAGLSHCGGRGNQ